MIKTIKSLVSMLLGMSASGLVFTLAVGNPAGFWFCIGSTGSTLSILFFLELLDKANKR